MPFHQKLSCIAGFLAAFAIIPAFAADQNTYELTLKDHQFSPAEITVPAGKAVKLHVKNLDAEPEEFDSSDLGAEKVITGKSETVINLHPLKAGQYKFKGEYHEDTAQGVVIAQ